MIHANQVKRGQLLVVEGLAPIFKTEADGERVERVQPLKNGETVKVADITVDTVTVASLDGSRKMVFAHGTGFSKLRPADAKEKAAAVESKEQEQQQTGEPAPE